MPDAALTTVCVYPQMTLPMCVLCMMLYVFVYLVNTYALCVLLLQNVKPLFVKMEM